MTIQDKIIQKAKGFGIGEEAKSLFQNVKGATFTTKADAKKRTGVSYLLGIDSSAKTVKNQKKGYLSGILYLAAADNVGVNICPSATDGCKKACLFFTGRASMISKGQNISMVNKSRFLKTALFFANRQFFMDWLFSEIESLIRKANRENVIPVVRLNGTSDINLKTFKNTKGELILDKFSDIQFYDYTKMSSQLKNVTDNYNYDVTFSYGGFSNLFQVFEAATNGNRISVPFVKEQFGGQFPNTFLGLPVINGDENDLTFLAPKNSVYGLKVKQVSKKKDAQPEILQNDFFITKYRYEKIEKMFAQYKNDIAAIAA
jgi:hypothetical protein